MSSVSLFDQLKASLPSGRQALELTGTTLLVIGLVSTLFGHAVGDGSSLSNLTFGLGITSAVLGGIVLGLSFYKYYREKHPEKTLPEWYQKLGAVCKGAFNAIADAPKATLWQKTGAYLLLAGALAIALAALHMHLYAASNTADIGALILGSVTVIVSGLIIIRNYKNNAKI